MKKILLLCFIMIFAIIGCSVDTGKLPNRQPDVTGLIYDIDAESQRILVVSGIDNIDIAYDEWFEKGNFAAFFKISEDTTISTGDKSVDFSALKKGKKVELWHTGVLAESYPMQGEAIYIKIIE